MKSFSVRIALVVFAAAVGVGPVRAQDTLPPNPHLLSEGIPAIPAALVAKVAPYTEFRPRGVASWHPRRLEMIVASRARNTTQLHRVTAPGAALEPLTD